MKIVSGRMRSREPIASALGWLATVKALPPVGRPTNLTLTRRGGEGVERRGDGSGGRRDELHALLSLTDAKACVRVAIWDRADAELAGQRRGLAHLHGIQYGGSAGCGRIERAPGNVLQQLPLGSHGSLGHADLVAEAIDDRGGEAAPVGDRQGCGGWQEGGDWRKPCGPPRAVTRGSAHSPAEQRLPQRAGAPSGHQPPRASPTCAARRAWAVAGRPIPPRIRQSPRT
eukprot:scaffold5688_cov116-Isochrysis_galbana.AAC.6